MRKAAEDLLTFAMSTRAMSSMSSGNIQSELCQMLAVLPMGVQLPYETESDSNTVIATCRFSQ
jgi:hypothetical protein